MNLISAFGNDEQIAGLQICDDRLKLARIQTKKKGQRRITIYEEPLPPGVVVYGKLADKPRFVASLQSLIKKNRHLRFVVLSLPPDQIFTKTLSLPKTISRRKINESVKLMADYQLPFGSAEAYLDWEVYENKNNLEILVAAIGKKVADDYLTILEKSKLKIVSVEAHPFSLLRSLESNEATIQVIDESSNSFYVYIFSGKKLRYQTSLNKQFLTESKLDLELKRIMDFFESQGPKISQVIRVAQVSCLPLLTNNKNDLVAIGAALRGSIPRSEDRQISLMPLSTQKAYEFAKALAFSSLTLAISWSLTLFFIAIFIGAFSLTVNIQQRTANQLANSSIVPANSDSALLAAKAVKIKNLTDQTYALIGNHPQWSLLLADLKNKIPAEILVSNINIDQASLSISGQANSRSDLNQFKKTLSGSKYLSNISSPLDNLEQRAQIPFTISASINTGLLNLTAQ